jgi:hypothetical protein
VKRRREQVLKRDHDGLRIGGLSAQLLAVDFERIGHGGNGVRSGEGNTTSLAVSAVPSEKPTLGRNLTT